MEYKDYYKVLGVPRTATAKEIKAAYRRLARKHHPDVNPGNAPAEARFKEVNEAHEVLSDPDKRKQYDALGADWSRLQNVRSAPAGSSVRVNVRGFGGSEGFSDFFETFFGGGRGFGSAEEPFGRRASQTPTAGTDVESEIELTLEEVLRGTTRTLDLSMGGPRRRVEVKVPPGVREGSRVRVAGEGAGDGSGRRGDLYLRVHVPPHPVFERNGDDLLTTVTVPLTTAVLGGEAMVPTLDGPRGIKVPAGSRVGQTFRLKGQGLPGQAGQRGDILARLAVDLPTGLSAREAELFGELKALGR
jgi:curved DNA-binding protein